jgi:hypothetical protein
VALTPAAQVMEVWHGKCAGRAGDGDGRGMDGGGGKVVVHGGSRGQRPAASPHR